MAQIRTGTCTVTNGSANVIASTGNDWSQAAPNSLFSIPATDGTSALYTVATVVAPGVSPSGFWEVNLTANYAGATSAGAAYQITKDFTPGLGLPIVQYGDTDTAILLNKISLLLEASATAALSAASVARKILTSDAVKISNATPAIDGTLQFAIAAGEKWAFDAWIPVTDAVSGGLKIGITGPASPTTIACELINYSGTGLGTRALLSTYATTTFTVGASGVVRIAGTVINGSTAGAVGVQWSQNVSTGGAGTKLLAGSRLIGHKIP